MFFEGESDPSLHPIVITLYIENIDFSGGDLVVRDAPFPLAS